MVNKPSFLVGYARVSTSDQNLTLQTDALEEVGCIKIFSESVSGAKEKRKGLEEALEYLREGDTLVVWRLDRLGRSLKHLIEIVNSLKEKGIKFRSLKDGIDTSTPMGEFFFHVTGSLAELERNIIRERTQAGLKAARARGRKEATTRVPSKDSRVPSMGTLFSPKNPSSFYRYNFPFSCRSH